MLFISPGFNAFLISSKHPPRSGRTIFMQCCGPELVCDWLHLTTTRITWFTTAASSFPNQSRHNTQTQSSPLALAPVHVVACKTGLSHLLMLTTPQKTEQRILWIGPGCTLIRVFRRFFQPTPNLLMQTAFVLAHTARDLLTARIPFVVPMCATNRNTNGQAYIPFRRTWCRYQFLFV